MNARHILPYIAGLVVLAFALGSLPRGTPGGSLLFNSTWLLYLIYLGPVVILGLMVALILLIGLNWRDIGGAIGYGLAKRRTMRKKKESRISFFVKLLVWAIAIGVLVAKPGTIFNPISTNSTTKLSTDITSGGGTTPSNPFLGGIFPSISSFVQNSWFGIAFMGILIVGGLVLVQSFRVAMKETSESRVDEILARRLDGFAAAHEAIRLVDDTKADARTRIIACFQHMILAVVRLGVPISADQTARELESAIRTTFLLKGSAVTGLTQLFEEARYSLHDIVDEDAAKARGYLESIAEELKIQLDDY